MKNIKIKTKTNFVCAILALLLAITAGLFILQGNNNKSMSASALESYTYGTLSATTDDFKFELPMSAIGDPCTIQAYIQEGRFLLATDFFLSDGISVAPGVTSKELYDGEMIISFLTISFNFPHIVGKEYSLLVTTWPHAPGSKIPSNVLNIGRPAVPLPPTPTKEGHTFTGWFLDVACSRPYDGSPIYGDTTLYAGWKINTHTITFNAVEGFLGSSHSNNVVINWNTVPTVPTPTREGYNFLGWFDGATKYENTALKTNKTFVARWAIKSFTVTFNAVEGFIDTAHSKDVAINWNTIPTAPTPTREGYDFLGWFEGETKYENTALTTNKTFVARWAIKTFTVTFNAGNGTISDGVHSSNVVVNWNTSATTPEPSLEGHMFKGWYNGETLYVNGAVTSNMTLTAKWEVIIYTVTFVSDGVTVTTVDVAYGTTFAEAMAKAGLQYYSPLTQEGEKLGKGEIVKEALTIPVGVMTTEEKIASFIGNNWWLLYTAGGIILVLGITLIIFIKKRG